VTLDIQAVQELQTATRVGLNHQEYSKRLIDTQIRVDRAVERIPAGGTPGSDVSGMIRNAMATYTYADQVWGMKIAYAGGIARISYGDFGG
jgi:hypothetical protein